jgi:hypothetical protein
MITVSGAIRDVTEPWVDAFEESPELLHPIAEHRFVVFTRMKVDTAATATQRRGHDMTTTSTSTDERAFERTHRRDPSGYIESVGTEGELFARAAGMGELDVAIAACPGWNMRDLVRHLGEIHLWAAANVAFPKPSWLHVGALTDLARYWPDLAARWPNDDELVSWNRATHDNLLDVLAAAPLDVEAFVFLPSASPLTMWARRRAVSPVVESHAGLVRPPRWRPRGARALARELPGRVARLSGSVQQR